MVSDLCEMRAGSGTAARGCGPVSCWVEWTCKEWGLGQETPQGLALALGEGVLQGLQCQSGA